MKSPEAVHQAVIEPVMPDVVDLQAHPAVPWNNWTISKELAGVLWKFLEERRPRRILELGSGASTAVLAAHASRHDAEVVSVEHDAAYHGRTVAMLDALGLPKAVELVLAPCVPRVFARRTFPIYDASLRGTFDFVFIDGPPMAIGREATLFYVWPHLAGDWEIWLEDGAREHEVACVKLWSDHFRFASRLEPTGGRGVQVMTPDRSGSSRNKYTVGAPALRRAVDSGVRTPAPDPTHPVRRPAESTPRRGTTDDVAELPLVSCIMPTHNRRRFVPRAISYFLSQDYPHRELVIVDDGTDPVEDLIPEDDRIRYVRFERRRSVGEKRNIACRHARGDVIAHWDDDDWIAPWRLRYQVDRLLAGNADVCGIDRVYFYDVRERKAWQYRYAGSKPWVAGGTLCYRKRIWAIAPFDDVSNGEDTRFVWRAPTRRIMALDDQSFYVAILHGRNSSAKNTRSNRWHARPLDEIRRIMGDAAWGRLHGDTSDAREDYPPEESNPRVTVAISYFRCRPYLRRAVESILRQSYVNLRIVVVNDGDDRRPWDLLADVDDPRLVRFDLTENRGRYFADAVVLAATNDPYFVLQDADDWSEPERVEVLLDAIRDRRVDVVLPSVFRRHEGKDDQAPAKVATFPDLLAPLSRNFEHRAIYPAGLFRTAALQRVGGCYGGFRIGYDSLLLNLLMMTGRVAHVDRPLYTYFMRAGSLTSAPGTGFTSKARDDVWGRLHEVYVETYALYERWERGEIDRGALAEMAKQTCARNVTTSDRSMLLAEAERLRVHLLRADERMTASKEWEARTVHATPPDANPEVPPTATTATAKGEPTPGTRAAGKRDVPEPAGRAVPAPPNVQALLASPTTPWTAWSISPLMAESLSRRLESRSPGRILELGSGTSTLFLAAHAAHHGSKVVTLEHDPVYFGRTRRLLEKTGLLDYADLRYAPLAETRFRSGHSYPWYRAELDGPFDFVVIDGPPVSYGREGALFALEDHLADDWEIWLKDGSREHERACLRIWSRHVAFSRRFSTDDPRGLWILGPPAAHGEAPAIGRRENDELPLVSCIMPTFNRRPFVAQAVAYFERQDYPNRELIVVDDGTDPVGTVIPKDDRIRYLRLDKRRSTGCKRNLACDAARGDVIICWDDDDWYAPQRISHQIGPMLRNEADVTALGASLFFCIRTHRFWTCAPRLHARMFYEEVIGGTLAFWADDWRSGPGFPDRSIAEDAAFLKELLQRGARLAKLPSADTFIYIRHGENSWRFQEGRFQDPKGWNDAPRPSYLPECDLAFYRDFESEMQVA